MSDRLARPQTAGLVELHVFYVPEEHWDSKLHTVSTEMISKFISAGFIRASPDMRLQELRERLGEFLWEDGLTDTFLFLKCVGRSLAVVKRKQEKELKLKSFAPPYALQPELYLLPGVDQVDNIPALSPDTQLYSVLTPDPQRYTSGVPDIQIYSAAPSDTQRYGASVTDKPQFKDLLPETQPQSVDFTQTPTSPQRPRSFNHAMRTHVHIPQIDEHRKRTPSRTDTNDEQTLNWIGKERDSISDLTQRNSHREDMIKKLESNAILSPRKEDTVVPVSYFTENRSEMADIRKQLGRNTARDSGIPESLTDRDVQYAQNNKRQEKGGREACLSDDSQKHIDQACNTERSILPQPAQYSSPPTPPVLILATTKIQPPPTSPAPTTTDNQVPIFHTEGEELIEELKQMKEERKHLEKNREELVKKAKGLLEQNKLRRNNARDAWKKKYYETKKMTAFLEEKVNRLRQELELYYQKLLTHLEARDSRKRSKHPTLALNSKNNMVIQVTTKQQEIDQLRRKLDNTKMKLVVEIKMRRQAASDLRALRAELVQKKIQSSLYSQQSTFVT